jgi:hypothetical protein
MADGRFGRRELLQSAAVAALGHWVRGAHGQTPGDAGQLTAYQLGPQVWVRHNGVTLTCYRAHPTQKYPYFHPLTGPATDISVTAESAEPYPHHRSVFLACDRLNGANYWQEGLERGRIVSRGPTFEMAGAQVVIHDLGDWRAQDGSADVTDQRRFTLSAPSPQWRLLEADLTLTAARDVTILRTNHSLFSVRAAGELTPKGGGTLVNSAGLTGEAATFGQPAAWCAFYGARFGVTEGVALMDHPENTWAPCPWFTRDYGFISPTPMNWLPDAGLTLAQGNTLRLRYLVAAFAGTPEEAGLPGVYEAWAAQTAQAPSPGRDAGTP